MIPLTWTNGKRRLGELTPAERKSFLISQNRRKLADKICPKCNVVFRPRKASQVNCSKACFCKSKLGATPWNKGVAMWKDKPHPRGTLGKSLPTRGIPLDELRKANLSRLYTGKPRHDLRGKNHWNWKGGISEPHEITRKSVEYKNWRRSVFTRDNYTCRQCGIRSGNGHRVNIHAHHISPFSKDDSRRFDVSNGLTLCIACHRKTETYGNRVHKAHKNVALVAA